jgi:hypothetical protein
MDIFNIIAGVSSILSLVITLLVLRRVTDIKLSISQKTWQKAKGEKITQAGGNINA